MAYSKGDLVAAMSNGCGCTKKMSADCLDTMLEAITAELKKGGSVTLTGFGTFKVSKRAARNGINPQTGASIKISARTVPTFKAGKNLKEAVK